MRKVGRRGGGRAGQANRSKDAAAIEPYTRRQFPLFRYLDEEGLHRIELAADTILEEVGMDFRGDPEVLAILKAGGAEIRGENARFPKGFCRNLIRRNAPESFIHHARNPARSVKVGGEATVFGPAAGSPFIHDLDRGRRYATKADYHETLKLTQALPHLHSAGGGQVEMIDLPVDERHLESLPAEFRLTDKPVTGAVQGTEKAEDTIAMAKIVFGEKFLSENVCLYAGLNTNSPLVFDATMTDALKVYARAGQAVLVSPYVLAGAMGPVTVAGSLAQQLAETMAGLALVQMVRPGNACAMGTFIGTVAMQSGAPAYGTPESLIGTVIACELARRLGVPVNCAGGAVTASKVADGQAMQESALTLQMTFLAGANIIWHCGGWLEGGLTFSLEKMILDAELSGVLQTFAKGLDVSDEGLALEAIREVGPGQHFFGAKHTLRNFRDAFWQPIVADTHTYEQWQEEGKLDAATRANRIWKRLLQEYEPPLLDPGIDERLRDYQARRLEEIRKR
jgi:trimethylamine---corrinoid protein Co-methyltransferase